MNKQRKVVITVTYNEMGIIIDTKAEELGSSAQPEPCEDAVSRRAAIAQMQGLPKWNGIIADSCVDFEDVISVLENKENLPPVTPKQRTEALKAEIRRMKRSFTTCINSDYYTGYMSALSAVEGYIAKMEGDAE